MVVAAVLCVQKADVYMFDEPSSYLDIKQRLQASAVIRSMLSQNSYPISVCLNMHFLTRPLHSYVVVVEHDLSVLDYLSDYVCCLYGKPAAYGVVTMPFSVRSGSYELITRQF